jgi:predicted DNA-binding transcriptional regulator AlpA
VEFLNHGDKSMTIKELAKLKGLTLSAIYLQIKEKRGYGRYFKRGIDGKLHIDGRKVK